MNKQDFIKKHNELNDKINQIIVGFDPDLEIDWRDEKEVEIHNFTKDLDPDKLVELFVSNSIKVEHSDFRYEETFRVNFEEPNFGSFDLESYSEEEFNEFLEDYEIELEEGDEE